MPAAYASLSAAALAQGPSSLPVVCILRDAVDEGWSTLQWCMHGNPSMQLRELWRLQEQEAAAAPGITSKAHHHVPSS